MNRPKEAPIAPTNPAAAARVNAFSSDALGDADGVELSRRVQAREVSPAELVQAAVDRARLVNPRLNAIAYADFAGALVRARRAPTLPFGGVPTFIKDTDALCGAPRRFGSAALSAQDQTYDSRFVQQLLGLGFIPLGKSTLPELGLTATTEGLACGPTHNPWRLGTSPGGSSGGAAALVAAGVVPLAHANDGGGSIRIPAACCGVVGLKPSRGRLPGVENGNLIPVRILHQGVITRTVRDTAAFYYHAERTYRNRELPPVGLVVNPGRRLRIGFCSGSLPNQRRHEACQAGLEQAVALCASLGHELEEIPSFFGEVWSDFGVLWSSIAFSTTRLGRVFFGPGFESDKLEPFTKTLAGYFVAHYREYPGAVRRLRQFCHDYAKLAAPYDVILHPTTGSPPPTHGFLGPAVDFETTRARLEQFAPLAAAQNVTGCPAISLPLAESPDGLPIGLQFAAPLGQERTLLELALELEAAAPYWGPRAFAAG